MALSRGCARPGSFAFAAAPIPDIGMKHTVRRSCCLLMIGVLGFGAGACRGESAGAPVPVTLDDLLHAESLGEAVFAPDGHALAYMRDTSIASEPTRGFDDASLVRERVFVTSSDGGGRREIVPPAGVRWRLLHDKTWAPDGSGILLLAARQDGYGLAFWDARSDKATLLPGRPPGEFVPLDWIGPDVLYAAIAADGHQGDANQQVLDGISRKWRTAWGLQSAPGSAAQVTVSSANPLFASTGPEPGSLNLVDPRQGTATKVADGNYASVSASPDGRHFAAIRIAEQIPDSYHFSGGRGELQLFERVPGGARLIRSYQDLDVAYANMAWAADGQRLLVGGKPAQSLKSATRLYTVEARNGDVQSIPTPGFRLVTPQLEDMGGLLQIGWLGHRPLAVMAHAGSAQAAAAAAPKAAARLDYGETQNLRLDVYAIDRGRPVPLTAFAQTSVEAFVAAQGAGSAYVVADGAVWRIANRPGGAQRVSATAAPTIIGFGVDRRYPEPAPSTAYYRSGTAERLAVYVAGADGKPQRGVLDLGSGQFAPTQARGEFLAAAPDQLSTVSTIHEGWSMALLLDNRQENPAELDRVNAQLKDRAVAPAEIFSYSFHDRDLKGWVVLPLRAKTPAPAIVSVYGGVVYGASVPTKAKPDVSGSPIFSAQLLAAQGYAVILPSTPLEAGADSDQMQTLAATVVAAVDALAARGIVDANRVGITGQSFGGYSTAAILAQRSDRFKAGVALAGIYDWIAGYGVRPLGEMLGDDGRTGANEMKMTETGQARLLRPFWQDPQAYMRNSPIFHVEKLDAPLLMLHGDLDMGATGLANAERMYNALVRAGKKPALVHYWGEGHVAQSEAAIRDQWQRMTAWFDAYVKQNRAPMP